MDTYQQATSIVIGILIVYGLATIVTEYDGPFHVFAKLRASKLNSLLSCAVCVSPYIALLLIPLMGISLVQYLAVLGGSIIIARII